MHHTVAGEPGAEQRSIAFCVTVKAGTNAVPMAACAVPWHETAEKSWCS
jgi:predicted Na+-dependent transporter